MSEKIPYIGVHVRIDPRILDALVKHYQATFRTITITRSDVVRMAIQDMADRELPKKEQHG